MKIAIASVAVLGLACTFSAHPLNGSQECSNDDPPRCPDGYGCVSGLCWKSGQLPATGGSSDSGGSSGSGGSGGSPSDAAGRGGDGGPCTPLAIECGKGAGKRCGKVPDQCGGTVECLICISGENCQTATHVCAPPPPACGQAGQPCCTGDKCTASDTICSGGNCTTCGGVGQPCCANDTCTVGTTCSDNATAGGDKQCLPTCTTITGSCTVGTDQDCSSMCGPGSGSAKIGNKTCTCASATWKCLTCGFPASADYSCYRLPAAVPACEATPPTIGASCTATTCAPCGASTGKSFIDATGTSHAGYCVCAAGRWNCAVVKEWPCPGNPGC